MRVNLFDREFVLSAIIAVSGEISLFWRLLLDQILISGIILDSKISHNWYTMAIDSEILKRFNKMLVYKKNVFYTLEINKTTRGTSPELFLYYPS
jgi:hypothetical protein